MNLAHQWVKRRRLTIQQAREAYHGCCVDFAGELIDALGRGRLAYFEDPPKVYKWKWHAAVEIDGMIHDLWRDGPAIPLAEYCEEMGCEPDYPAEEEEPLTA